MVNYIVSGCPRSGTSMLMRILEKSGMPIATDEKRGPDESNVHGYFEVESIIDRLKENPGIVFDYDNKVLKVINYGIKYLPEGDYMMIYIERDLDEVMASMEKMTGKKDPDILNTKRAFESLNEEAKKLISERSDIRVLPVKHGDFMTKPGPVIDKIINFYGINPDKKPGMLSAIDKTQYRNRKQR